MRALKGSTATTIGKLLRRLFKRDFTVDPEDVPMKVYHYTSFQTAFVDILPSGMLRLSPAGWVNDPLESCTYNFATQLAARDEIDPLRDPIHPDGFSEGYIHIPSQDTISWHRNNEWNVLCMSLDHMPRSEQKKDVDFTLMGHGKPSMWAHYANNHSGVCLVFDGQRLHERILEAFDADYEVKWGRVSYRGDLRSLGVELPLKAADVARMGSEAACREFIRHNHKEILFTKHTDWCQELEFRWTIHRERSEGDYEFLDFGNSLQTLILGHNVSNSRARNANRICNALDLPVPVLKAYWEDGSPHFFNCRVLESV